MKLDVAGRVRNVQLPASKPLLPIFESVVNSIQAIEDAKEEKGKIHIKVIRDKNILFTQTDQQLADITNFVVVDNGIGFDESNYEAFTTSDTTFKASRGGKGIGRFMWLAAFESVEIDSLFTSDGKMHRRHFVFCSGDTGIENHTCTNAEHGTDRQTTVSLNGLREKYRKHCPKRLETIAIQIVEEFLDYFLGPNCPNITLQDESTGDTFHLDTFYDKVMGVQSDRKTITIEKEFFEIVHVRLYSHHIGEHRIYFCAHGRSVIREKLTGIANMARRFTDSENKEFVYAVYVNSSVLDHAVNADRTGFNLSEDGQDLLVEDFTLSNIRDAIREHCKEFLIPFTEPIAARKRERVQRFIQDEGAMYRPILQRLEAATAIDAIDPEATDDEIDRHLYDAYHEIQVELREEGQKLLRSNALEELEFDDYRKRFEEFFEKISEVNRADLARYVCHRKAIIEFLQKQLSLQEDGKYKREDRIHSIIFPRGKTSNELLFEDHNLWLVDERLAFHALLSSDQPIQKAKVLESTSRKKPDILLFDKAVAFTESQDLPFTSVTIIEFKRPLRDDYNERDNPFSQVFNYVDEIKAGKAKNTNGRPLSIPHNLPFYCYIICDITPRLKDWARISSLRLTPDGLGFFGYNENYGAYCEVISYDKLVVDAQKRNQAFFSKLQLPNRIFKEGIEHNGTEP